MEDVASNMFTIWQREENDLKDCEMIDTIDDVADDRSHNKLSFKDNIY